MADQRRDWDKEMAAIDQVIAKGGYVAPSGGAPAVAPAAGGAPGAPTAAPSVGRHSWIGTWVRTLLGVALAVGLSVWPWWHGCGLKGYFYLAAVGLLALTGIWVMLVSWRRRSGLSHLLGLLMLAYAVWLGASEVLPKVGYAKVATTWSCPAE
jgi:hypothetical protein